MRMHKIPAVLIAGLILLGASTASATEPRLAARIEKIGPWTQGVSEERQQQADALFNKGNELFEKSVYKTAAAQYRAALKHWDHPAIHFNLALALTTLDQPVEIRRHLAAAIRYGADPLDLVKFEYARRTLDIVEQGLARVRITCDEPGASVTLDGEPLFVGPGQFEDFVRPGPHTLIATKEGYLTTTLKPALSPGQQNAIPIKMRVDQLEYRRKWSVWKPWALVGTGVALAAGGGVLYREAREDYRAFDADILKCGGCVPESGILGTRKRGDRMHRLALGTWAAGGAALVTGTALVLLNRPEPYRPLSETPDSAVVITPLVGGGTRGVLTTFSF